MSWFSSLETEFNYDFDVSLDKDVKPLSYNYMSEEATRERLGMGQELLGVSVFLMRDGKVFHTYSGYGRQVEVLVGMYHYLDRTPLGRQEEGMKMGINGFTWHGKYEDA